MDIPDSPIDAPSEEQELYEHRRLVVDKGQEPMRIDKYLVSHLGQASRTRIQYAAEAGNILVGGKPVKSSYRIKPLDQISLVLAHPPREIRIDPENIPIDIVYEDDDLIVINKKAGMVVHPAQGNYSGTLVNALLYHMQKSPVRGKRTDTDSMRPGLVHRLDKDTSGLLVAAKNELSLAKLAKEMFDRKIIRIYHALVWGVPKETEGTVSANIGRSKSDRKKMAAYPEGEQGKPAVTHYKILESFGYISLLECRLETGRTHQIRVHMKHIGHPLFGDADYGGDKMLKSSTRSGYTELVQKCLTACPRQALHARYLSFEHPVSGKIMGFNSEFPDDILSVIGDWKKFMRQT